MGEAVFLIGAALAAALLWRMRPRLRKTPVLEPDADLQVALHLAEHEAAARRHAAVEPLHLLYAVAQNEEVTAALEREGVDVAAVDAHFQRTLEALDDSDASTGRRRGPRWSAEAQQLLVEAAAEARAMQRDVVTIAQLASRLTRNEPELVAALEPTGLSRATLLAAIAGSVDADAGGTDADTPPQLTAGEQAEVVLHNDDFTPMELVVAVLREQFEYDERAAIDMTMAVHNGPPAAVGCYEAPEAERRRAEAVDRARAEGYPLRFTLRRAGASPTAAADAARDR